MEDDIEASPSASTSDAAGPSGGSVKPWVLVPLLSAFIVTFLPTFLSSASRGFRPAGMKGGWDAVNLALVLFAILCGVLCRRRPEDDAERSPLASTSSSASNAWLVDEGGGYGSGPAKQKEYFDVAEGNRGTGIRRMRSSSSYPDLRQDAWGGDGGGREGRRFYDDIQLYRRRSETMARESQSLRSPETKTIPVDTFVLSRSPSRRSRSPPSAPSQRQARRRSVNTISDNLPEKNAIFQPEKSHPPSPPSAESIPQLERHRMRRSLDNFSEMKSEQDSNFATVTQFPSPPEPEPATLHRRGRNPEKLPKTEVEQLGKFTPEKLSISQSTPQAQHRRRRSVDDTWGRKAEKAATFEKERAYTPALAPPPPPTPPPLLQEEKRRDKKRSGRGAKDIASAISSFYQKKKGSKKNRAHDDISLHLNTTTSTSPPSPFPPPPPPPPPPPLPSSVFYQLFSKKGGSKYRKIHSLSSSTTPTPLPSPPPPPPPPPPPRYSRTQQDAVAPSSTTPPPLPVRRSCRQVPLSPPLPPPLPPRSRLYGKKENSNHSRFSTPPVFRPPPPPPPVPKSDLRQPISAEIRANHRSSRVETGGSSTEQGQATPGVTVFCPSPDVNNEADLFIARFRAGLKLEEMNSLGEKERRKEQ